jgi:hypothetical protein
MVIREAMWWPLVLLPLLWILRERLTFATQWREAEQNAEQNRAPAVFKKRKRPNSLLFSLGTHGTHADFDVFLSRPLK